MGTSIEDDRGRVVPVHGPVSGFLPAGQVDPPWLSRRMKVIALLRLGRAISLLGTLLLVSYLGLVIIAPGEGLRRMIPWAIVGAMIATAVFLLPISRAAACRLRRTLLAAGRCASCGYPLERIEDATDGCRVCPECGAAWRLADAGRLPGRQE